MDWSAIGIEILRGGFKTALMVVVILMPLMVGIELVRDARLLDKAARWLRPLMRLFGLPAEGAYPLLAGVFFGISYGSGVIIAFARDGSLSRRDMFLIGIFLAICHGMIEDPLVFTAIGANWFVIVLVRVILAVLVLIILARVFRRDTITPDQSS
jgi:hypothetical protein